MQHLSVGFVQLIAADIVHFLLKKSNQYLIAFLFCVKVSCSPEVHCKDFGPDLSFPLSEVHSVSLYKPSSSGQRTYCIEIS